jgi:hypothetical protein
MTLLFQPIKHPRFYFQYLLQYILLNFLGLFILLCVYDNNYVEKTLKETEIELANEVKVVKETQGKTIKHYEFLQDVIRMTCPMVLR